MLLRQPPMRGQRCLCEQKCWNDRPGDVAAGITHVRDITAQNKESETDGRKNKEQVIDPASGSDSKPNTVEIPG
jgi:hypothetical protein